MRYWINIDKTVNQLVPYYLGGRKLILYLQAILHPLQGLSDRFSSWAKETRIEASMTSQVFKLEWFLNRRFSKYFMDPDERITFSNAIKTGLALYYQDSGVTLADNPVMTTQQHHTPSSPILRYISETPDECSFSFLVSSPRIDTRKIRTEDYLSQLQYWIDRYRIAGKTYKIIINQ